MARTQKLESELSKMRFLLKEAEKEMKKRDRRQNVSLQILLNYPQKWKISSKIKNFVKNRKFRQKSKISSKIENFVKNRKLRQKSKISSKIKILLKNRNFFKKPKFYERKWNFVQKSKLGF